MSDSLRDLLRQRASDAGGPAQDLAAGALERSRAIGRRRLAAGALGAVAGLAIAGMAAAALVLPGDREEPAPPIDAPMTTATSPAPTESPTEGTAEITTEGVDDGESDAADDEPTGSASQDEDEDLETTSAPNDDGGIDPRLETLVGTWEAAYEDVGPHGSSLTINEDGTATLWSFANQHGPYEGEVILGSRDPHRFEGVESETQDEIVIEFRFDPETDTLTLTYPGGEDYVHYRE